MRQPPLTAQDRPLPAAHLLVVEAQQRCESGDRLGGDPLARPHVVVPGQAGVRVDGGRHARGEAHRQLALFGRVVAPAQLVGDLGQDRTRRRHDAGHEHVTNAEVDHLEDPVVVEADLGHLLDQPEVAVVLLRAGPLGRVRVLEIGALVGASSPGCTRE